MMNKETRESKKPMITAILLQFQAHLYHCRHDEARKIISLVEDQDDNRISEKILLQNAFHVMNASLQLIQGELQKAKKEFEQVKRTLQPLISSVMNNEKRELNKEDALLLYLEAMLGIAESSFHHGQLDVAWQELEDCLSTLQSNEQLITNEHFRWLKVRIIYWQATVLWKKRSLNEAHALLTEGLSLLEKISNFPRDHLKAEIFKRLGSISRARGELDEALHQYRKCLEITQSAGYLITTASVLNSIGLIYQERGELDQALEYFKQSLELSQKSGTKPEQAATLTNIGISHWMKGQLEEALHYFQQCLKVEQVLGNTTDVASTMNNIGLIYQEKGDFNEALRWYHQALELSQEKENRALEALILNNIGSLHRGRGDLEKALNNFSRSLEIFEELGSPREIASALTNVAVVYRAKGELQRAMEYLQKSVTIFTEIGALEELAECHVNLALIHRARGDDDSALTHLTESLNLREKIGNPLSISETLFFLVLTLSESKNKANALEKMTRFYDMLQNHANRENNRLIIQRAKLAKALTLLVQAKGLPRRQRLAAKLEAESLLTEVIAGEVIDHEVQIMAILTLCKHLIMEYRMTHEKEILDEIITQLDALLEIARQQHSYSLLAEGFWLLSKVKVLKGEIKSSRQLIRQAKTLAEQWGFHNLARRISSDLQGSETHSRNLSTRQAENLFFQSFPLLAEQVKLETLLEQVKRQETHAGENFQVDHPTLLLILSRNGILLYSRYFSTEVESNPQLISAFLSALQSFSQELFNRQIEQMTIGEHNIILFPINDLLITYFFKGSMFSAIARMQNLSMQLMTKPSILEALHHVARFGGNLSFEIERELTLLVMSALER